MEFGLVGEQDEGKAKAKSSLDIFNRIQGLLFVVDENTQSVDEYLVTL